MDNCLDHDARVAGCFQLPHWSEPIPVLLVDFVVLLLTLGPISLQAVKAAGANPVKALKFE